ncbi:MAG TPA: FtsX-like permease family protein [bacterium]|nr:FtsX-like permease family protein [bacterium]
MFKIAFRNIFRQKRRTLLTVLTMLGGYALSSISIGYADGTYSYIIDQFTRTQIGHVQVHEEDYLDEPSLYKTISDYTTVGQTIQQVDRVNYWAPRLYTGGLAAVGDNSSGVQVIGIDPRREVEATRFNRKIIRGRLFSAGPQKEVLLGKGLAEVLEADLGDEAVIVSQAADGSIANDAYEVIGIVESGNQMQDRSTFYLPLQEAQNLFVLPDQVHEIVVVADNAEHSQVLAQTIAERLQDTTLTIEPWMEVAKSFYQAMRADVQGMWIMLFVIILVVAIGVLNTVLMSVLERTREYGVLKAMGTRPGDIFRMVIYEVSVIAILGIIVGAGISLLANSYLAQHGIPYPEPVSVGGIEVTTLYGEVNNRSMYIPAITVWVTAFIVSLLPALKAARIEPARAMRIH